MRIYDAAKDDLLILYWFLKLRADPAEFENLFMESARNLTALLHWAKHSVAMMIDVDDDGIRFAAWLAPFLSGAELGAWARKNLRGSKGHLKFMDAVYEKALAEFPVLVGLTKQPQLHNVHLKMGYEFKCEIPSLFDGAPLRVYTMTKDSRARRHQVRREIKNAGRHIEGNLEHGDEQPVLSAHRKIRKVIPAVGEGVRTAGNGSPENGRSERADTDHKPRRGRKPRGGIVSESGHTTSLGESRAG